MVQMLSKSTSFLGLEMSPTAVTSVSGCGTARNGVLGRCPLCALALFMSWELAVKAPSLPSVTSFPVIIIIEHEWDTAGDMQVPQRLPPQKIILFLANQTQQ